MAKPIRYTDAQIETARHKLLTRAERGGFVMKNSVPVQLTLFHMPQKEIRGLSFTSAIRSGLRPYEYK